MRSISVACKLRPNASLPEYGSDHAAGADLRAWIEEPVTLGPGERRLIPTGLAMEIPRGYEGQVRPRSGIALTSGLTILNAPGTIDSDYRGEIHVLLVNLGTEKCTVAPNERIAQLVIAPVIRAVFTATTVLSASARGEAGFGSTGR